MFVYDHYDCCYLCGYYYHSGEKQATPAVVSKTRTINRGQMAQGKMPGGPVCDIKKYKST